MTDHMPHRSGFTMIEVLVALMVLALAIGALLPRMSLAALAAGKAERREQAVLLAESLLARMGADLDVPPGGEVSGREGGFDWRLSACCAREAPGTTLRLVEVHVEVSWTEGRHRQPLRLETRRLTGAFP